MFAINKIILFQKWVYLLKKHVDILGKGNISIKRLFKHHKSKVKPGMYI